jgi:membrane protein required for colicin V production
MNLLDIIVISMMVFFVVKGLFRGFFREIASLTGFILGISLGNHFQPLITDFLSSYLPSTKYLPLIAFTAVLTVVVALSNILGMILKLFFRKLLLKSIDRTFGAGLAFIKGLIVTYLMIVILTFLIPSKAPLIAESKLTPIIIRSYQSMISVIPRDHLERLKNRIIDKEEGVHEKAGTRGGKDG